MDRMIMCVAAGHVRARTHTFSRIDAFYRVSTETMAHCFKVLCLCRDTYTQTEYSMSVSGNIYGQNDVFLVAMFAQGHIRSFFCIKAHSTKFYKDDDPLFQSAVLVSWYIHGDSDGVLVAMFVHDHAHAKQIIISCMHKDVCTNFYKILTNNMTRVSAVTHTHGDSDGVLVACSCTLTLTQILFLQPETTATLAAFTDHVTLTMTSPWCMHHLCIRSKTRISTHCSKRMTPAVLLCLCRDTYMQYISKWRQWWRGLCVMYACIHTMLCKNVSPSRI